MQAANLSGAAVGVRSCASVAAASAADIANSAGMQGESADCEITFQPQSMAQNAMPDQLAAHAAGICRPCAWFHTAKGCRTGTSCDFCHACGPGELKRRKRMKAILLATQKL